MPSKENNKNESTSFCYLMEYDGKILWAYTALIENINKNVQKISYFDINGNIFFSMEINSARHKVLNKESYQDINRRVEALTRGEGEFPYDGVGDCTAHSMADAVTDNGWWSILLDATIALSKGGGAVVLGAYCWAACMDCWMFGLC